MSAGALLSVALFVCPAGSVIDRVEGSAVVVLGSTGVRVVARSDLVAVQRRLVHEGDRLEPGPGGSCMALPPSAEEVERLRQRLRALSARPARTDPRERARP